MTPEKLQAAHDLLTNLTDGTDPRDALYANWFHEATTDTTNYPVASEYHAASLDLVRFEPWEVTRSGLPGLAAAVEISRNGRRRIAAPPDVIPDAMSALAFKTGDKVLANPLASTTVNGFWHLFSPLWQQTTPPPPRLRLYFAVKNGAETRFVRTIASNASLKANWSMKILTGNSPKGRCDTALLYLPDDISLKTGWVADLLPKLATHLGPVAVPGTTQIAPGIACAPDTSDEESFGQRVCQAIADIPLSSKNWTDTARTRIAELGAL